MESMMIIDSTWNEKKSFRMYPITNDCPFVEAMYDPISKVLAVLGKEVKQKSMLVPKLDKFGRPLMAKGMGGIETPTQERIFMDAYHEYYIEDRTDILEFLKKFAVNSEHASTNVIFEEEIELSKAKENQEDKK